jgi:hypothetical protein
MSVTGFIDSLLIARISRQQRHARCRNRRGGEHGQSAGQLCNDLLHKLQFGVRFSKCSHIFEVSRAKPSHARKGFEEVMSQPVYYLCSPPFRLLTAKNVSADAPIEQYEFPIDGQTGAQVLDGKCVAAMPNPA